MTFVLMSLQSDRQQLLEPALYNDGHWHFHRPPSNGLSSLAQLGPERAAGVTIAHGDWTMANAGLSLRI